MDPKKPSPARSGPAGAGARPGAQGGRPAGGSGSFPAAAKPRPGETPGAAPRPNRRVGVYKANLGARMGASAIDLVVGGIPALVFLIPGVFWMGILLILAYLLVKDGLPIAALEYRSVGKRLLGMHVESDATGDERIDLMSSVKRNAVAWGGLLPLALLWKFSLPIGLALAVLPPIVELIAILRDANGQRFGDRLARTRVLD